MKVTIQMVDREFRGIVLLLRLLSPIMGDFITAFERTQKNRKLLYKGLRVKTYLHRENIYIDRCDGSKLRLLTLSSGTEGKKKPCILWFHGGGYGLGTPEQDIPFAERFIDARDAFCVIPEYTLSIDKPYPAALNDAYHALKWLRENAETFGGNPNQIFVGGDSGGGGLALALALYARDMGEVKISFMMPLYPMIDDRMSTLSMKDNDAPVWDYRQNYFAWQKYLGELFGTEEVPYTAAPYRAKDLSGLPPAVSFVGNLDPFKDEASDFFCRLKSSGIAVDFEVYDGVFHAFDIGRPKSEKGSAAIAFLLEKYLYACENYYE